MSLLMLRSTVSGGGSSLLQDWTDRSTASGVLEAIRFTSDATVDDYKHGTGTANDDPNVYRDAADGILGDGCLRIDVGTGVGVSQYLAWRHSMNSTWTSVSQGIGTTDFYIQFRFKPNTYWLQASTDGGGCKIANIAGWNPTDPPASLSFTEHEVVLNNEGFGGYLRAYTRNTSGGVEHMYTAFGGSDFRMQSSLDRGSGLPDAQRYCLYSDDQGCYFFDADYWYTLYVHLLIPTYNGTTGNRFRVSIARQDESSYTSLFDTQGFEINDDATYSGGPNGIWFLPYDTGRTGHAGGVVTAKYDQLITSTLPIACPLPGTL